MDQILLPYRSLMSKRERAKNIQLLFAAMVSLAALIFFGYLSIHSLVAESGSFKPYIFSALALGSLFSVLCFSARREKLERGLHSKINGRLNEKLLMAHGVIHLGRLPRLGAPDTFVDLKNESVEGVLYLSSTGVPELRKLEILTKENS